MIKSLDYRFAKRLNKSVTKHQKLKLHFLNSPPNSTPQQHAGGSSVESPKMNTMMAATHAVRAARGLVGACLGTGAGMTPPIAAAMPVLGAAASLGAAAQNALVARFSTNHKVFKGYATTTTAEGETQQGKGGSRRRENVDTSGFAGMRGDERLYHVNGIDFPVSMEEILTGQVELPEDFDVETHFGSWEESERPRPDLVERVRPSTTDPLPPARVSHAADQPRPSLTFFFFLV